MKFNSIMAFVAALVGWMPLGIICSLLLTISVASATEPGVTAANYNRIKSGMSQKEVEAILGGPCDEGWLNKSCWHGKLGWAWVFWDKKSKIVESTDWIDFLELDALLEIEIRAAEASQMTWLGEYFLRVRNVLTGKPAEHGLYWIK